MAAHDPTRSPSPNGLPTADPTVTGLIAELADTTGDDVLTSHASPIPASAGRYELGEEIAHGGMGVVYRATDTAFRREIAVKVLQDRYGPSSAAAHRFAEEARITGQLQHPSIPPAHDLGTLPDGRPFLAMKLIKGETLDSMLEARSDPAHDRGRFLSIFESICQALAYAHDHHVIHRDLKPANIMVGAFGEVQVMDWGLAKVLGTHTPESTDPDETRGATEIHSLRDSDNAFTLAGSILGTPSFMPPEQAIGAIDKVDERSDVFGLGGILCVILTGKSPFVADTAENTRQAAAKGKVTDAFNRLDACRAEPELVALCKKCLAAEKEDRPTDAREAARAVAQFRAAADERARRAELEKVRLEGERATSEARGLERRKRRKVAVVAAGILVLAVLAVQRHANANLEVKNKELADKQIKVEKRFELAQKAIAKLHTGVGEDMLLKSDQFKELRTQLLKEAADFYGELEKLLEGETDAKSRRLLADGYFQLGTLTGKIGSRREAIALHGKALAIRRELAAVPGVDLETRLDVARSLGAVGTLLNLQEDLDDARRALEEQHEVVTVLESESPTEAVRGVRAKCLVGIGGVLWKIGKSAAALTALSKAVDIQRELADANRINTELRSDLAGSLSSYAIVLRDVGQWAEELEALGNARDILEKLIEENRDVTPFRHRLGYVYNNIADSLFNAGKQIEALEAAEKARGIMQKLTDTYPAVTSLQNSLAINHLNVGRALSELREPAEAMAAYEEAIAGWQKVAAANSNDIMVKVWIAYCYNEIGELQTRTGKRGDALRSHEQARALLMESAKVLTAFHWVQIDLARSYEKIGLLLAASEKSDQALASCAEALAIRQKVSDTQPEIPWMRAELAGSLTALGTVQRRAGRPADAVASFSRAIALVEQSSTPTPRDLYTLASSHALLAAVSAEANSGLTPDQGVAEAERAMTTLRQAIAAGFSGAVRLRTDTDLDALRRRVDFQNLVKQLEAKLPKTPELAPPPRAK